MTERASNTVKTNVTRTKLLKIDIQYRTIYQSCALSEKIKKLDLLPLRFCYKFMQTYTCVKEMNLAHFKKKDILPDV